MIRRFMLLLVSAACVAFAFGQPAAAPPADAIEKATVSQLLAASEPGQLAWGAYLAGNYQQKSAISAIIPLLRFADASVQLAAIDALIRLDADVPEEDLSAFLATNQIDPVLVLLARDPKKHGDFLMRLLNRELSQPNWVAVSSILSMAPPPGFAARLLRQWNIHYSLQVIDKGGFSSDGDCRWISDKPPSHTPGFPPMFLYVIDEGLSIGNTVLATGPHPVSYQRTEPKQRNDSCISQDEYRLDYLKSLARIRPDVKEIRALNFDTRIRWVDAAKYEADAETLITGIRTAVSYIRNGLIARGLLTPKEATEGPKVEVVITDLRQDRRPLPVIDWRLDK